MFDVIEHVPVGGEMDALVEAFRVLKKKGVFLLSTPNNSFVTNLLDPAWYLGHRHYKPKYLITMIENAGFKVKTIRVRGSVWSSIYMCWFYFVKWIFGNSLPRNNWLERKEDEGYDRPGVFTIFVEAVKI